MNLEDRMRDAMHAHEHEAPSDAELVVGRRAVAPGSRARTPWLPALAAASVVLAVVGAVLAIRATRADGHRASPGSAALNCPQRYHNIAPKQWVPARARGVDAASRLVPDQRPDHVVVCAYLSPPGAGVSRPALSGSRYLGGDLAAAATALTWLPRQLAKQSMACTSDLQATDGDAYLVGFTYSTGTVWVSAPGDHCSGAWNGQFATAVNLRVPVAGAYRAGRWTVGPSMTQSGDRDPCHVGTAGRLGQETALVPGKPVSATVCKLSYADQSSAAASKVVGDSAALAAAMNSLPTVSSTSSCGASGPQSFIYEALFRYSQGPPVFVRVLPNCHPSIDNLSLQADGGGAVVSLIQDLLAGR